MSLRDQIQVLKKEVGNVEITEENLRSKQIQLEQREDELEKTGSWSKSGKDVHEIEQAPLIKHELTAENDVEMIKSGFTGLMQSSGDWFMNTFKSMGENMNKMSTSSHNYNMKDLFEEKASKNALD